MVTGLGLAPFFCVSMEMGVGQWLRLCFHGNQSRPEPGLLGQAAFPWQQDQAGAPTAKPGFVSMATGPGLKHLPSPTPGLGLPRGWGGSGPPPPRCCPPSGASWGAVWGGGCHFLSQHVCMSVPLIFMVICKKISKNKPTPPKKTLINRILPSLPLPWPPPKCLLRGGACWPRGLYAKQPAGWGPPRAPPKKKRVGSLMQ